MPSPSTSPKRLSHSNTKTQRSSVSKAFDLSVSKVAKESSVATVGTITDPNATAPELLATAPILKQRSPSATGSIVPSSSASPPSQSQQVSQAQTVGQQPSGQLPTSQDRTRSQRSQVTQNVPEASHHEPNENTQRTVGHGLM